MATQPTWLATRLDEITSVHWHQLISTTSRGRPTRHSEASRQSACCRILRTVSTLRCHATVPLTFNISQHSHIVCRHKVDRNTLASEPSTASDTVNVVLPVRRQVIVDHQRYLLNVYSTRQQVRRDQHARRSRSELFHQHLSLLLLHISVLTRPISLIKDVAPPQCPMTYHGRDREFP